MPYLIADYVIERLMQQNVEAPVRGARRLRRGAVRGRGPREHPARPFHTVVNSSDLEAGYAADGYARVRGLSAVSVSYGVGTLSLVNAVAGAYIERSPVVCSTAGRRRRTSTTRTRTGVLFSHSMGRPHLDMEAFSSYHGAVRAPTARSHRAGPDRPRSTSRAPANTRCTWKCRRRGGAGLRSHRPAPLDLSLPAVRRAQRNRCCRRSRRRPTPW